MWLTLEKVLIIWNIIVFFIYGIDKWKAKRSKYRTSEFSLLLCAFLLGAVGALFGMVIFNHKTSKPAFRYPVPIFVFLNPIILDLLQKYVFPYIVKFINSL
ncbi:MAG: DUF1294 domain-containing protein [Clostridia bacterium]|nr:DUF1294 domain-containing protein [Clostridia bacterium]